MCAASLLFLARYWFRGLLAKKRLASLIPDLIDNHSNRLGWLPTIGFEYATNTRPLLNRENFLIGTCELDVSNPDEYQADQ